MPSEPAARDDFLTAAEHIGTLMSITDEIYPGGIPRRSDPANGFQGLLFAYPNCLPNLTPFTNLTPFKTVYRI
jgi:hypothetical protein